VNEATVSSRIITHFKECFGSRVVCFKHNDRLTAGIPDISITAFGTTHWFEVKLLKAMIETEKSLRKHFDMLQLSSLVLMEKSGKASYLVAVHSPGGRQTYMVEMSPEVLMNCFKGEFNRELFQFELTGKMQLFGVTLEDLKLRMKS
jgi:hypothetical protein